jgi:hypothetical protein
VAVAPHLHRSPQHAATRQFPTNPITMLIKIKTIIWMIGAFIKEIYELITGKRK